MIETKDSKRSLLIPKWTSHDNIGQDIITFPRSSPLLIPENVVVAIQSEQSEFRDDPTVTKACNLLHSGLVTNDSVLAREAASFILEQSNVPPTVYSLASRTLGRSPAAGIHRGTARAIREIRHTLRDQSRNALLWTELARLHTIKGAIEKAERCIDVASYLAPLNRFIVRAAARFYIHVNRPDRAHYVVLRASEQTNDPWIRSTLINSALLAEIRVPKFPDVDVGNIDPKLLFQYSEFIASLAVVELRRGNERQAKRLFRKAWDDPSESVVAHAEWVIRNYFPHLEGDSHIDFRKSAEASSWRSYFSLNLPLALEFAREWALEEPYSTHPFSCGSSIACSARDFALGADLAREGLAANPNDYLLINNLAYSLLKQGLVDEAHRYLLRFPRRAADTDMIFLLATTGLYLFKTSRIDLGRKFYQDAYDLSRRLNLHKIAAKAHLCLAEAEAEAKSSNATDSIRKALAESVDIDEPSIKLQREFLETRFLL